MKVHRSQYCRGATASIFRCGGAGIAVLKEHDAVLFTDRVVCAERIPVRAGAGAHE